MARMGKGNMGFMGFEKEPPQPHGPRPKGKVLVHSHSARPRHKISPKRSGKRAM